MGDFEFELIQDEQDGIALFDEVGDEDIGAHDVAAVPCVADFVGDGMDAAVGQGDIVEFGQVLVLRHATGVIPRAEVTGEGVLYALGGNGVVMFDGVNQYGYPVA